MFLKKSCRFPNPLPCQKPCASKIFFQRTLPLGRGPFLKKNNKCNQFLLFSPLARGKLSPSFQSQGGTYHRNCPRGVSGKPAHFSEGHSLRVLEFSFSAQMLEKMARIRLARFALPLPSDAIPPPVLCRICLLVLPVLLLPKAPTFETTLFISLQTPHSPAAGQPL